MASTTIPEETNVESIPLQTLSTVPCSSVDHDAVRSDCNSSQNEPEPLNDPQEEQQHPANPDLDPASAPANGDTRETPPYNGERVEKWQLRLNATQVVTGVLGLAGFIGLLYPQIIDHFYNQKSLKLAQWEAWKDFRDECRTLASEARNLSPDCLRVLHEPLHEPPTSRDVFSKANDSTNVLRALLEAFKPAQDLTVRGNSQLSMLMLTAVVGTVFLVFIITQWRVDNWIWRILQQPRTRQFTIYETWVSNHIPRFEPGSYGMWTTGLEVQNGVSFLWKRVGTRRRNLSQNLTAWQERAPKPQTDLAPFHESKISKDTDKNAATTEIIEANEEDECLWLAVGKSCETDAEECEPNAEQYLSELQNAAHFRYLSNIETVLQHLSKPQNAAHSRYLSTIETVLEHLHAIGYGTFVFEQTRGEVIWRVLARLERDDVLVDSIARPPSELHISTSDDLPLGKFFEALNGWQGTVLWVMKLPGISLDHVHVGHVNIGSNQRWKFWQKGDISKAFGHPSPTPCLYVIRMSRQKAGLVFVNVSDEAYCDLLTAVQARRLKPIRWDILDIRQKHSRKAALHRNILQRLFDSHEMFGLLNPNAAYKIPESCGIS